MSLESVLFDEKKSSTYKFALVSAIIDYIIEKPNEYPKNGFHNIPIIYLAKRWLYYYYPLMIYEEDGVRQGNTQIALSKIVREFSEKETNKQLVYSEPEVILNIKDKIESNHILSEQLVSLILKMRRKVVEQPLKYIQIASNERREEALVEGINIKDPSFTLFGLINTSISLEEHDDYQKIRQKCESWVGTKKPCSWIDLEADETAYIQMGHYTYTELAKSRFFIKDAVIKRWTEFTIESYLKSDAKAIYALFHGLYMHTRVPERGTTQMRRLREIAVSIFEPMRCIYCEEEIKSFELDHFIPWSKFPVDRFWNLFPTCKRCNSKKSDKIIELEDKMNQKLVEYLKVWLEYFRKNNEEMFSLGGKEMEYVETDALEKTTDFLIEQIKEIHSSLS